MTPLPDHVLRPTSEDHEPAWGEPSIPPVYYAATALEVGRRLDLTRLGATEMTLEPGTRACPLHHHAFETELFLVLEGVLTKRELDPGATAYREYELHPGELVVYPPGTGIAHQSQNRSDGPVRYLALSGAREPGEVCVYPDSGKTMVRGVGVGVFGGDSEPILAAARAAARLRPVHTLDRQARPDWVGDPRRLASLRAGVGRGSGQAGLTTVTVEPLRVDAGSVCGELRWHRQDEEMVLVRSGRPALREVEETTEHRWRLQPGDWVRFAAGRPVAHQLCADDGAFEVLVIGARRLDDVTHFPERGAIHVRALGQTGALRRTAYFAGE